MDVEAIIQGAAGGAEASGGRVNERSVQLSEGAGYPVIGLRGVRAFVEALGTA